MNNNKSSIAGSFSIKNCAFKYMVFLFSVALFSGVNTAYAERDATISASYDTYFSNKSKKTKRKNYDDKPTLLIKRGRENIAQTYIKFNVADLRDKETVAVRLNIFVSSLGKSGRRLILEKMDPNTLGPRNNWKNRPVQATHAGVVTVNNDTARYLFNISRIVNTHLLTSSSDDIIFRLRVDGKGKKNWLEIASLEGVRRDREPLLTVDFLDRDDDGVPDTEDAFPDDPSETGDRDEDGVGDNDDNCPAVSNPDQANQDDDSAGDACDAFPTDSNETTDTDGDGVGDNSDAFPANPDETVDTDGDGVGDNSDNCPALSNFDQDDADEDGVGNACDAFPNDPTETTDTDGDGVSDNSDAFPTNPNETTDTDGDGTGDNSDNCPYVSNPDQENTDSDGAGNVCDAFPTDSTETVDSDGDGTGDNGDNCPDVSNPDQADSDGNGIGDACDGILTQYTPQIYDWTAFNEQPFTHPDYAQYPKSHGVDSEHSAWINWTNKEWDGHTIYNTARMTQSEFRNGICNGSGDTITGLRELYYAKQPFADELNPTKAEVDEWHRLVINHLRVLSGLLEYDENYNYVGNTVYEMQNDHCLYARSLWSAQRKNTTMWNEKYPLGPGGRDICIVEDGEDDSHVNYSAHCGSNFRPDYEDQKAYLPEGHAECTFTSSGSSSTEGINHNAISGIVWAIKIGRAVCGFMPKNTWDPHAGPVFFRTKLGMNFWSEDTAITLEAAQKGAEWRLKGSGVRLPDWHDLDACGLLSPDGKLIGTREEVLACPDI